MDYKKLCKFNVTHSIKDFYLIIINGEVSIVVKDIFASKNELMLFEMCYILDTKTEIPEIENRISFLENIVKSKNIKSIDIIFHSNSGNEYTVELPKMNEIFSSSEEIVNYFNKLINTTRNEK